MILPTDDITNEINNQRNVIVSSLEFDKNTNHILNALSEIKNNFVSKNINELNSLFSKLFSLRLSEETYYNIYSLFNIIYRHLTGDGREINSLQAPYDSELISKYCKLLRDKQNPGNKITIITTTCKRFELFYRTVNSVIKYVTDLHEHLYEWIVIDDNSDDQMRDNMREKFPFITYVFKDREFKGHSKSMNMIFDLVKTPYVFNIEDDWEFFFPDNYISKMLNVFAKSQDDSIGQVLVNINYAEDVTTYKDVRGSSMRVTTDGQPYWIHNHYTGEELTQKNNELRRSNNFYWPHFSLRVGIAKVDVLRRVGKFNENASHFEMEYGQRYVSSGYKTAFLNGVFCLHIGRRTYERQTEKVNAYDLNEEKQFGEPIKKEEKHSKIEICTFVINLERRLDRLKSFVISNKAQLTSYDVINGFDGKNQKPTHKIMRSFRSGDYDYRSGIVGCAISHVTVIKKFLQNRRCEYAIVLEDDVTVCSNFEEKIVYLINRYRDKFDVMMLHQNPWNNSVPQLNASIPTAVQLDVQQSFKRNMGSAAAYLITRQGAINLLRHINQKGFYNAFDWVLMKTADEQRVLYSEPMLAEARCFQTGRADTDIQKEFSHLKFTDKEWDSYELNDLYNLLIKSVYHIENKKKIVTIRIDPELSDEQVNLIKSLLSPSEFYVDRADGDITVFYSSKMPWNRCVDNVIILPLDRKNADTCTNLNRYAVKWYYTNKFMYIVPDKYVTNQFLLNKVFGEQYLNLSSPF